MSDEQLERALWERLQNMEQELLLLSNPNYDSSFFFYKKDSDNEEEEKMKQEYALVKRARDLLMDKDRRELYLDLLAATVRGSEWEEQIKDVLMQIPEEAVDEYPDPMFEGEDPSTWEL